MKGSVTRIFTILVKIIEVGTQLCITFLRLTWLTISDSCIELANPGSQ